MSESPAAEPAKLTFAQQMKSFPAAFWVANVIELVERFSFYGVRTIAALYIITEAEKGGLELTNTDKGIFFGTWSLIQCLLPMFTGGFAEAWPSLLSSLQPMSSSHGAAVRRIGVEAAREPKFESR